MASPFIGQIQPYGFNFAPKGWAFCNGDTLQISQYTSLFSLIGVTYGGDAVTTFKLPDLRGRVPIHFGSGPGLSSRTMGEVGGSENVTLTTSQMPMHNHIVGAVQALGDRAVPVESYPAADSSGTDRVYSTSSPTTTMGANMINNAGGNQPHNNMQPYLVFNWCIALYGIYPSRG
ncbi:MAG TPA: phage tail protein [Phycisphaerales bacterium]|nr:phage tail protein [Phycisphaerales bacterium]